MLRKIFIKLHRWVGLTLGVLLMLSALTGSILTAAKPLNEWFNPLLFQSTGHSSQPHLLSQTHATLAHEFGSQARFSLRPPRQNGDTLWVKVSGAWNGTVYIDPVDGKELGRRANDEGFINTISDLHSDLLLKETGKTILFVVALSYIFLFFMGIWLWWPKNWKHAWTIKCSNTTRLLFDLHRVGGVLVGTLILVLVISGAYMAYKPIGTWLNTVTHSTPAKTPNLKHTTSEFASIDDIAARAQTVYPDATITYISLTSTPDKPIIIRLKLPDDPHPNGRSSVTLNPTTAEILSNQRWNQADTATRVNAIMYPLHIGQLAGVWHIVLTGLLGLSLFGLGVSGIWLWWKRR